MTFAARAAASTKRLSAHLGGTTVIVRSNPVSAFGNDLSVTLGTELTFTANCSAPIPYRAQDSNGARILTGMSSVFLVRTDAAITFDPQPGMIAEVSGEQYRIKNVDFQPGHIQLDLEGGAAEGTAGS